MKSIGIGSQVKYARHWLKSINAAATDPLWRAKGTVTAISKHGQGIPDIATVEGFPLREDGSKARVLVNNLSRIDALEIEL